MPGFFSWKIPIFTTRVDLIKGMWNFANLGFETFNFRIAKFKDDRASERTNDSSILDRAVVREKIKGTREVHVKRKKSEGETKRDEIAGAR